MAVISLQSRGCDAVLQRINARGRTHFIRCWGWHTHACQCAHCGRTNWVALSLVLSVSRSLLASAFWLLDDRHVFDCSRRFACMGTDRLNHVRPTHRPPSLTKRNNVPTTSHHPPPSRCSVVAVDTAVVVSVAAYATPKQSSSNSGASRPPSPTPPPPPPALRVDVDGDVDARERERAHEFYPYGVLFACSRVLYVTDKFHRMLRPHRCVVWLLYAARARARVRVFVIGRSLGVCV